MGGKTRCFWVWLWVIFYIDQKRRPSRIERIGEPRAVRKLLKQWESPVSCLKGSFNTSQKISICSTAFSKDRSVEGLSRWVWTPGPVSYSPLALRNHKRPHTILWPMDPLKDLIKLLCFFSFCIFVLIMLICMIFRQFCDRMTNNSYLFGVFSSFSRYDVLLFV